jgi:hypothetical protein
MERPVTRIALLVGAALVFDAGSARAQAAPMSALTEHDAVPDERADEPPSAVDPGYFNGLGTRGHGWEVQSDTTFSTSRTATQRFALGHAFPFNRLFAVVARVDTGADSDTTSGLYAIHGPLVSIGIRDRSKDANHSIEIGVRLIPSWNGPNDTDPAALGLSLGASLSSANADDARWLSFATFGWQVYGVIQNRTNALFIGSWGTLVFGTTYGGEVSLAPLEVRTWLGPQEGVIGNAFWELFADAPRLGGSDANIQIGVHGEASLSSIWPADTPLPLGGNAFVGWSPKNWFAARVFAGIAGSAVGGSAVSNPYGVRLVFYVP